MKAFDAVWLGDSDPASQFIRMGDLAFVKGQKVHVPADHQYAHMIMDNPTFSTEGKAQPVEADEPSEEELAAAAEAGTEKAALKADLAALGVVVKGNPSLDTLRQKLVDATAPK